MSLASGSKLGPYEILAPIGAGGMGEVYRAKDTRLKREVALKVLPETVAADPERMVRFQREAEVLASLNHPNIAQIYGVEERALVMELVEGESPEGPMPFDEAWKIASQMVAALEYAHDKGIVHRDLKPANVKITPEGVLKLLDFGLAKAFTNQREASVNAEDSPTLTIGATEVGVILGTAAYMSPEQARGKKVDRRADIWAFGVVLYEFLTGQRLFSGEDVSETLAQVLTKEPDLSQAPPQARRLLRRCLERDPRQRLRDIGEARFLLEDSSQPSPPRSRIGMVATAATGVLALAALAFIHFRETPPQQQTLRYKVSTPENSTMHSFAVSPDGRYIAIATAVNGKRQLWLRPLDSLQAQPMLGTEDSTYPFWSPDSRYIGFFAQGKLRKIAVSGGPAQSLCDATNARGGSWSRNNTIVFAPYAGSGAAIQGVSAAGGVPADLTRTKGDYRFPVFLPDGSHLLYTETGASPEKNGVYISSVTGKENQRVLADVSSVVFAVGHLLFIRETTLMAQPFDAGKGQTSGDAFPIAEGVSFDNAISFAPVTASESGMLLYASSGAAGSSQIVWFDRAGKTPGSLDSPGAGWEPAISPDEKTVAFRRSTGSNSDIWRRDLARGTDTRLTFGESVNLDPSWSPKGDRIVFNSNRGGPFNLYQTGGSGRDELLFSTPYTKVPNQWSRDDRFIVYSERDPRTNWDLWVLPVGEGSDRKPIPFLQSGFNELYGQISPDGRWMAYTSDESGQREVYVRPFPASDYKARISTAGGEQPRWRADGKELFFVQADGKITAVPVKAVAGPKPSFEPGAPVPLFESHIGEGSGHVAFQYDVTANGKRFLVATTAAGATSSLTVVVNWSAGLKR